MASRDTFGNWTVLDVLNWTQSYFSSKDIDSPRLTAEMLLCHCLEVERIELYLQYDRPLNSSERTLYREFVARRVQHEPVAYITGKKGFWEHEFQVAPDVLIPRPDTETLVEKALEVLERRDTALGPATVLELGVGSGAVVVSLAVACPEALFFASDISWKALDMAAGNARSFSGVDKVFFVSGSWFGPFRPGKLFDLIVSNPPYIPSDDIPGLQPEINMYEPRLALDGGRDGLDCVRIIVSGASDYLRPGGVLLIEVGAGQRSLLESMGAMGCYQEPIRFYKDYAGHDRVVMFKKNDC